MFVALSIFPTLLIVWIYQETPDFLKEKTHAEKKTKLGTYIGELNEELNLYAEARDLESRIDKLRKK